ncbi:hypothetical protein PYCCODRAFT_81110 [Trametes coccinea BRFM310]|uniref:Uncharacterized protein n=1 Tax=Trametes coccinea (strain BRFM310) TaxID=1353009 RepID=A0A1Y2IUS7_TRAC3|nr:hypothetical protein PYCCODRAFT_81110 [Trametes coccinea BRFM310]
MPCSDLPGPQFASWAMTGTFTSLNIASISLSVVPRACICAHLMASNAYVCVGFISMLIHGLCCKSRYTAECTPLLSVAACGPSSSAACCPSSIVSRHPLLLIIAHRLASPVPVAQCLALPVARSLPLPVVYRLSSLSPLVANHPALPVAHHPSSLVTCCCLSPSIAWHLSSPSPIILRCLSPIVSHRPLPAVARFSSPINHHP